MTQLSTLLKLTVRSEPNRHREGFKLQAAGREIRFPGFRQDGGEAKRIGSLIRGEGSRSERHIPQTGCNGHLHAAAGKARRHVEPHHPRGQVARISDWGTRTCASLASGAVRTHAVLQAQRRVLQERQRQGMIPSGIDRPPPLPVGTFKKCCRRISPPRRAGCLSWREISLRRALP